MWYISRAVSGVILSRLRGCGDEAGVLKDSDLSSLLAPNNPDRARQTHCPSGMDSTDSDSRDPPHAAGSAQATASLTHRPLQRPERLGSGPHSSPQDSDPAHTVRNSRRRRGEGMTGFKLERKGGRLALWGSATILRPSPNRRPLRLHHL